MKCFKFTFSSLLLLASTLIFAQNSSERASPAKIETNLINGSKVTINYSSPAVKGRVIWGDLVPYNSVWRTGANEATTIEFQNDVKINNTIVEAGLYALFTLPIEQGWKVILNTDAKQWGSFNYDQSKDVLRFDVVPIKSEEFHENLIFKIEKNTIILYWENLKLSFPIDEQ
jgi:Protein of unknown function (DUF2911)